MLFWIFTVPPLAMPPPSSALFPLMVLLLMVNVLGLL
jgi:hypothetical protein